MFSTARILFVALFLVFALQVAPIHAGNCDDCNDGLPCTLDSCGPSGCVHTVTNACNDGNPCTIDGCDAVGCTHVPVADPGPSGSTPCNAGAGNCTTSGWCVNGQCNAALHTCNDNNACTYDGCTLSGACWHSTSITPQEIGNLVFSADRVRFSWERPPNPCGPVGYSAVVGSLVGLPVGGHPEFERCIWASATHADDVLMPASGEGFWYEVRAAYFDGLMGPPVFFGRFGRQRINGVESYRETDSCP